MTVDPGDVPNLGGRRPTTVVQHRTTVLCTCPDDATEHLPGCPDVAGTSMDQVSGFVATDPATPLFDAVAVKHPGLRANDAWLTVGQILAEVDLGVSIPGGMKPPPRHVVVRDERGRFVSTRTLNGATRVP